MEYRNGCKKVAPTRPSSHSLLRWSAAPAGGRFFLTAILDKFTCNCYQTEDYKKGDSMEATQARPAVETQPEHPRQLEENKRLSLICFSGEFDKLVATFTLASGAAAVGYEVSVFFTFWGLNVIRKAEGRRPIGKGFLARFFNFLQGGRKKLPLSRLNFGGLSPKLMTHMMKKQNVATLPELIDASKALGVNLYACEMSMHILGTTAEDFVPEVKEVIGVAKFLEYSSGGERIFI